MLIRGLEINMLRIILLVIAVSTLTGCGLAKATFAYFQSTDNFIEINSSGVFYEDGSKDHAVITEKLLPAAIKAIEEKQNKKFKEKVAIYICNSKESFSKYSGAPKIARGAVFNGKLFISPRAVETDTLNLILIHELSHLHFHQYVGNRRYASNIPPWFQEGLAVYVSGGGGAEKVTHEAAKKSMLQGNTFTPNKSGSLIFPKTAFWFGLKPQMFYRQSSMFVDYLSNNYKVELQEFIAFLFDDMEFNEAFNKAFDKSIDGVWVEFIDTLTT